jgi:hypothetical protein
VAPRTNSNRARSRAGHRAAARGALAVDAAGAFAVPAPDGSPTDPQAWADPAFRRAPGWVGALLALRHALVGLVGIERVDRSAFDSGTGEPAGLSGEMRIARSPEGVHTWSSTTTGETGLPR